MTYALLCVALAASLNESLNIKTLWEKNLVKEKEYSHWS